MVVTRTVEGGDQGGMVGCAHKSASSLLLFFFLLSLSSAEERDTTFFIFFIFLIFFAQLGAHWNQPQKILSQTDKV